MGFNVAFILANEQKTTLLQIARGLKRVDAAYRFESGEYFIYANEVYGQVEINRPGDKLFESDIDRYKHLAASISNNPNAADVLQTLATATGLFFVRVLWEEREHTGTLLKYEPLFDWFFANRDGLLFVDGEGFYNKDGLLLPLK